MPTARSIAYAILALIAGALAIAGTLTSVFDITRSSSRDQYTLWEACATATAQQPSASIAVEHCYSIDELFEGDTCAVLPRFDAMRAFSILTALVAWLAAVPFAIVDIAHPRCMPPATRRVAMSVTALCLFIFSVVAWAVFVSLWELECNGSALSEAEGAAWGPMAPLMLVVSILALAMGVVAVVVPGGATEEDDVERNGVVMGQPVLAMASAPPNAAAYAPTAYHCGSLVQQPGLSAAPIPSHCSSATKQSGVHGQPW